MGAGSTLVVAVTRATGAPSQTSCYTLPYHHTKAVVIVGAPVVLMTVWVVIVVFGLRGHGSNRWYGMVW